MPPHEFAEEPGPAAGPPPLTPGQKVRTLVRVAEPRLRFVCLMAATGMVFAYWDPLWAYHDKWTRPPTPKVTAAAGIEFYCPMHPAVVQADPALCPACGMSLSRRAMVLKEKLPEGVTARVRLSPRRVALAGISTVVADYAPLAEQVTTVGYVEYDERRLYQVAVTVKGTSRVERLYANFTGVAVETGKPLVDLYSPEFHQATRELLLVGRRGGERFLGQAALGQPAAGDRKSGVSAAREKLFRFGASERQVNEIQRTGRPGDIVEVLSPVSGHVVKKNVVEGQFVSEGQTMFEVVDLSAVWVQAKVYETQVPRIHVGQSVEATAEALPGRRFPGSVAFIQPHLDPGTRTVDVRYDLKNPGHELRPGMYATVTFIAPLTNAPSCPPRRSTRRLGSQKGRPAKSTGEGRGAEGGVLSVPESAVIDTGRGRVIYVESGPGVFEGREAVLGPLCGDRYPVLDGLDAGEKVAAAGAFLIDAETRLNPGAGDLDAP